MKTLPRLILSLVVINSLVILAPLGFVCGSAFTTNTAMSTSLALTAEKAEPLDLNPATGDQLKALPGIGDVYSENIIKPPYKRKDALVQKKIIPQATYDKIKDQIVADQK